MSGCGHGLVGPGRSGWDKGPGERVPHKAMSYSRLTEKQKVLAAEVSELLAQVHDIDAAEDARFGKDKRGDELPLSSPVASRVW